MLHCIPSHSDSVCVCVCVLNFHIVPRTTRLWNTIFVAGNNNFIDGGSAVVAAAAVPSNSENSHLVVSHSVYSPFIACVCECERMRGDARCADVLS